MIDNTEMHLDIDYQEIRGKQLLIWREHLLSSPGGSLKLHYFSPCILDEGWRGMSTQMQVENTPKGAEPCGSLERSVSTWFRLHIFASLNLDHVNTTLKRTQSIDNSIWAAAWQNKQNDLGAQRRLRSTWAYAKSDKSLRCALNG